MSKEGINCWAYHFGCGPYELRLGSSARKLGSSFVGGNEEIKAGNNSLYLVQSVPFNMEKKVCLKGYVRIISILSCLESPLRALWNGSDRCSCIKIAENPEYQILGALKRKTSRSLLTGYVRSRETTSDLASKD